MEDEKVVCRDACMTDVERLAILNGTLGYPVEAELLKGRLDKVLNHPAHQIIVAEVDGLVVGFIHGADYLTLLDDDIKDILALVVADDYQGRAIGRHLIAAFEAWAQATGATQIRLNSGITRESAHRFYEKQGYVHIKNQKKFLKSL